LFFQVVPLRDFGTMQALRGCRVRHENGEVYEHTLEPDQDPRPIAVRFTKEIRKHARGESIPGFYRRLAYSDKWMV
jgi:hypothetical protein